MGNVFIEKKDGNYEVEVSNTGTVLFKLGVDASKYASLAEAVAAIGSNPATLYIYTPRTVTSNLTIPSTLALVMIKPGLITINSGATLTINGPFDAGLFQVFGGAGTVVFGNYFLGRVYPQWWGACVSSSADQTTFIEKAIDTKKPVHLTRGTWLCNLTISNLRDVSLEGEGFQENATILKTYDNSSPVITVTSTTYQVMGVKISDIKIDGNNLSQGLYLTATTPYIIHASTFENIWFEKCTRSINIHSGTQAEEVYGNLFRNIYIYNPPAGTVGNPNYGIYSDGGVENVFQKVMVANTPNYTYSIYCFGTHNSFYDVAVDGCIRSSGGNMLWNNVTIETIYCTTPPEQIAFRLDGDQNTVIGLQLVDINKTKCNIGLKIWRYYQFVSHVIAYGADEPDYAVMIDDTSESSGVLFNIRGGTYTVIQAVSEAVRRNWLIRNCGETYGIETHGTAIPTNYISNRGDRCWNSTPSSGGTPGWSCVNRQDTTIRIQANETDTTIEVVSTSGMLATDLIGIVLDNGSTHYTTINSITDADTLVITSGIPAGRHADVGAAVYTCRWKAMANLA